MDEPGRDESKPSFRVQRHLSIACLLHAMAWQHLKGWGTGGEQLGWAKDVQSNVFPGNKLSFGQCLTTIFLLINP